MASPSTGAITSAVTGLLSSTRTSSTGACFSSTASAFTGSSSTAPSEVSLFFSASESVAITISSMRFVTSFSALVSTSRSLFISGTEFSGMVSFKSSSSTSDSTFIISSTEALTSSSTTCSIRRDFSNTRVDSSSAFISFAITSVSVVSTLGLSLRSISLTGDDSFIGNASLNSGMFSFSCTLSGTVHVF